MESTKNPIKYKILALNESHFHHYFPSPSNFDRQDQQIVGTLSLTDLNGQFILFYPNEKLGE